MTIMAPTVNILFQNPARIFFPGQQVAGTVEISSSKIITCKAVSLKLSGSARVHFTVRDNKKEKTIHRRSNELYYSLNYKLWGDGQNAQNLPSGKQQFPFSFILPLMTPSSFESEIGYVRHICEVTLEMPTFKLDIKCLAPFSVVSLYDLNNDLNSVRSILTSDEKRLCCLCCASGPISFTVHIDRSGYVPGENIVINAECSNKSNRKMSESRAEVVQLITYKAEGCEKTERRVVCFKQHPQMLPGSDDIWSGELLPIPPLPPTQLLGCNIIDVNYGFVFKIIPKGPAFSLQIEAPLIIGSIPLRQMFSQFAPSAAAQYGYTQPQMYTQPAAPPLTSYGFAPPGHSPGGIMQPDPAMPSAPPLVPPGFENYPDLPPPSYEESVFGATAVTLQDLEYDGSDDETCKRPSGDPSQNVYFSPRYISYHLNDLGAASRGPMVGGAPLLSDVATDSDNMNICLITKD